MYTEYGLNMKSKEHGWYTTTQYIYLLDLEGRYIYGDTKY